MAEPVFVVQAVDCPIADWVFDGGWVAPFVLKLTPLESAIVLGSFTQSPVALSQYCSWYAFDVRST